MLEIEHDLPIGMSDREVLAFAETRRQHVESPDYDPGGVDARPTDWFLPTASDLVLADLRAEIEAGTCNPDDWDDGNEGGYDSKVASADDADLLVILTHLPPGFLDSLEPDLQATIEAQVGKEVRLLGYDEHGCAEVEWHVDESTSHTIWVDPACITTVAGSFPQGLKRDELSEWIATRFRREQCLRELRNLRDHGRRVDVSGMSAAELKKFF